MSWFQYDLRKRFANFSYEHNHVSQKMYQPAWECDLDYERPYFNIKETELFEIISNFEDLMKSLGFSKEFLQFQYSINLKKIKFEEIIQKIELFVNIRDVVIEKEIDGEVFKKVRSNPKEFYNHPLFINPRLKSLQKANDEDIFSTNILGRNIFYYVNDMHTMNYLLQKNKHNEKNGLPHVNLFSCDHLMSSVLNFQTNLQCFQILLQEFVQHSPEMTNLFFTKTNALGQNATVSLTMYLENLKSKDMEEFQDKVLKCMSTIGLMNLFNQDLSSEFLSIFSNKEALQKLSGLDVNRSENNQLMIAIKTTIENLIIQNQLSLNDNHKYIKKIKL